MISDNVANADTVGYKRAIAQFQTMLSDINSYNYSPGGVLPVTQKTNLRAGLITASESETDLAITGHGFFPVSDTADGDELYYTRAGSFTKNSSGYYINSAGYFLKGWQLDQNGALPTALTSSTLAQSAAEAALVSVNVDSLSVDPIATTAITLQANLKASETSLANNSVQFTGSVIASQTIAPSTRVSIQSNLLSTQTATTASYNPLDGSNNMASGILTPHHFSSIDVYDSSGTERRLRVGYLKTAADTWAVEVYSENAENITAGTGLPDGLVAYGTATFNSNGTLASISSTLTSAANVTWNSPSATSAITFNFGTVSSSTGLRQSADSYSTLKTVNPSYNPAVAANSMSSGTITPHYSHAMAITDNTGTARTINVHFLRTGDYTWAAEVSSNPTTAITVPTGGVAGQIAYGTIEFNTNGTLKSISPALSNPMMINYTGTTELNSIQVDWGSGGDDGLLMLSNSGAAYSASTVITRNYDPTDDTRDMSSGSVTSHFNRVIDVVDEEGTLRSLNVLFLKTGLNTWAVEVAAVDVDDLDGTNPQIAHGMVTFNGDGTLASISDSLTDPLSIDWENDTTSTITLSLGTPNPDTVTRSDGLSQLGSSNIIYQVNQNGNVAGENAAISIDDSGTLIASYTNGSVRSLYKIPLVSFVSNDRLAALSSNVFEQTNDSGDARYFQAGASEQTTISSGSLERSNVDLSEELSSMIIAQRSYQSNSKLFSVSDNMLETLAQVAS